MPTSSPARWILALTCWAASFPGSQAATAQPAAETTTAAETNGQVTEARENAHAKVLFPCCGDPAPRSGWPHPELEPLPFPRVELSAPAPVLRHDIVGSVFDHEPFGPAPTSNVEELEQLTAALATIYRSPDATEEQIHGARETLRAHEPTVAIPAWHNVLIGLDLRDEQSVLTAAHIVLGFQESVAGTPTFFFSQDDELEGLQQRVRVLDLFREWWGGYDSGPQRFRDYRKKVAGRISRRESGGEGLNQL
jgi:hypothetical protein